MNVLIHQGALGDWVLTFPILRALTGPTVVAASWSKAVLAADLFDNVAALNIELREFSRMHMPGGPATLGPAIQEVIDQARLIVSFVSNGADDWASNVHRLTPRAKHVFVEPRPPESWRRHVCDWHNEQLQRQGLNLPEVPVEPRGQCGNRVLIHPGSGGSDKRWPAENFEILIATLQAAGHTVNVVLGEVEQETWPQDLLQRWSERYGAEPIKSLATLGTRIATSDLYVGNDSGPTHLAAQMGVPTVAMFGPTCPAVWGPRGPAVTILAPPNPVPMTWLNIALVAKACGV